jgi:CD109 antigen
MDIAGDGIEQQLLVEPEGSPVFVNKAVFLDLRKDSEFNTNVEIVVPDTAIPDSTKTEVTVFGDLLGTSIENLASLIR